MARSKFTAYVTEHPRTMGVLFTVGLLLAQAGSVAANMTTATNGP